MSQLQPEPDDLDYEPRFLPPEPDEMFDDTLWNERAWQPGWRPPGPRPPMGQPWPRPPFGGPQLPHPPPSPGKWPFWGYWGFRMLNAWRDIKFLRRLVADMQVDMLQEAIKDGIIAPGPNSPVPGPGGGAVSGPILGVTDGSDAAPGQVGEFMQAQTSIGYAAYPQVTTTVFSAMVIPPGDWDFWARAFASTGTGGMTFVLQPPPTGMSNDMQGALESWGPTTAGNWLSVVANARGNFSTPTLLPFSFTIDQGGNAAFPAGNVDFLVEARRRR